MGHVGVGEGWGSWGSKGARGEVGVGRPALREGFEEDALRDLIQAVMCLYPAAFWFYGGVGGNALLVVKERETAMEGVAAALGEGG